MVSFFNSKGMCFKKITTKQSQAKNWLKKGLNLAILLALLLTIAAPAVLDARTSQLVFSSNILKEGQKNQIVIKEARGVSPKLAENSKKDKPHAVVRIVITAYTSTPDQTDSTPFIAASGKRVYDGMVAANWLPFGTKIKIPSVYGDKIFTVDDRMNSRYSHGRMDIWLDASRSEAIKFGVKVADVEVYYETVKLSLNR